MSAKDSKIKIGFYSEILKYMKKYVSILFQIISLSNRV